MPSLVPVLRRQCPNCGGDIDADRLARGLPCASCLPSEYVPKGAVDILEIGKVLGKLGKLNFLSNYHMMYILEEDYRKFAEFFREKYGFELTSAQRSWARRLLYAGGESFSIVAPTGVGKTTLLMAYAAFMALSRPAEGQGRWRSLYIVPTENLVAQTSERLVALSGERYVAYYYSSMQERLRESMLERFKSGDFSIGVITPGFLVRNFDLLRAHSPFKLVIVDDVDSLLRNSKNIDRVLVLLGFPAEAVDMAFKLVQLELEYASARASGREERAEDLLQTVTRLRDELAGILAKIPERGQLVIASATGRPKGIKHLVFRELLNFEVGSGTDYLRNVVDSYVVTDDVVGKAVELVKRLGKGGLVFVSQAYGKAVAKELAGRFEEEGIPVATALTNSRKAVERLASGEVWAAIGMASRYGVLVRGIDLPTVIRYAVFVGVPAVRLELKTALLSPRRLLRALMYAEEKDQSFSDVRKRLETLLKSYLAESQIVAAAIRGNIEAHGRLAELRDLVLETVPKVASFLEGQLPSMGSTLRIGTMVIRRERDGVFLYSPDAPSYIQASGRTSRLFEGAMTKGLAVIVDTMKDLVDALQDRLRWVSSAELVPFESLDLPSVVKEIEESRKPGRGGKKINVVTELIIVESPTKAKTIANFWGRPARRRVGRLTLYETTVVDNETGTVHLITVTASKGHVLDLEAMGIEKGNLFGVLITDGEIKPIYTTIKRCLSCGYQFTEETDVCPRCGSSAIVDAKTTLETLKRAALWVDRIIIMTDPDREGEKIAWDLYLTLRPFNQNIYRSAFHEVTVKAFMEALRNPGAIDERMVSAQIARRIDDRWIGFATSQYLWALLNRKWLGAGRVQTPVLGWVIKRYDEYKDALGYKVRITLPSGTQVTFYTKDKDVAEQAAQETSLRVKVLETKVEDVNPLPPYTTDEMIFDASARLGYPAELTMKLAQDLFYSGLITYHRTDSTRVSDVGMGVARQYLESHGLAQYYRPRPWGAGGAHEAIRPTRPLSADEVEKAILDGSLRVPMNLTGAHLKLYQMIFERFIASQMLPATVRKARVRLSLGQLELEDEFVTEIIKDGFTRVYRIRVEDWVPKEAGSEVVVQVPNPVLYKGSLVPLYRSGDLVMLMKEKGIGRPSTYAKIIETIKRHGYVAETKKSKFLVPTSLGRKVYEILMKSPFMSMLTEEQSKWLEDRLDEIERGELSATDFIESVREELVKRLSSLGVQLP